MSFTSSKLQKQDRTEPPGGTLVQQLPEPVAGRSNGAEVSVVIHRIEMGIEAMRSDISGSSLVDAQVRTPIIAKEVT
jgi:hypothetical protein